MLGHKWIWISKPDQETRLNLLKEALLKGTVCISVSAWFKNDKGLYFVVDDYKKNSEDAPF